MPFEIVRNDIVNIQVDAVVNTANPNPVIGSGVDSGIHKKAGHELLAARQKIGCIDFCYRKSLALAKEHECEYVHFL